MENLRLNNLKNDSLKKEKMRVIKGGNIAVPCSGSGNKEWGTHCDKKLCDASYYNGTNDNSMLTIS